MMVAVLLGALTLGACVDDNESASVTAVREAKAKQLTALAEYNSAQAQAELIIANADAAIKAAEAKYQEAQAKIQDLVAQEKELELQKAQATLETELLTLKAEAEADLNRAQADLEIQKAALIAASDQVDLATKAKIQNLIKAANAIMYGGQYEVVRADGSFYLESISSAESIIGTTATPGLKMQLIKLNADLVAANHDLADTKAKIAGFVADEKVALAKNEALLKAYTDNKTTSKEEATTAYNAANEALIPLLKVYDDTRNAYYTAGNGTDGAITKAVADLNATEVMNYIHNNSAYGLVDETPEIEDLIITYDDGTVLETSFPYYYETKWGVNTATLQSAITNAERNVTVKQNDYKTTKTNYDAALAADNAAYKALKDAVIAAKTAFDADPTAENRTTLETAETAQTRYEDGWKKSLSAAQKAVDGAKENLANAKKVQTLYTGDAFTTYTTVYGKYVDAVKAASPSYVAYEKAMHNYNVQLSLVSALGSIMNGYTDWNSLIAGVEQSIRTNKKNIDSMTDNGSTTGGYTEATRQAYIDALGVKIAEIGKQITIKQAQYDGYMKDVDALIKAEETPAQ